MARDPRKINNAFVSRDSMPLTCPRCGWPCTHLVRAYWPSPWNEHGGMCHECCMDACAAYDRKGTWPDDPAEVVEEKVPAPVPERLFDG